MAEEFIEVKVERDDNDDYEYEEAFLRTPEQQEALLEAATRATASIAPTTAMASSVTVTVEDELDIKTELDIKAELLEEEEEQTECTNMNEINTLSLVGLGDMKVVDEQADIITLSAATEKTEDEQNFMMSCLVKTKPARKRKQTFYQQTCTQCKETFNTRRSYEQHSDFGLCSGLEKKYCCSICPLSFSSQVQLDTHLSMHSLNRFFCAKNCGKFFNTLDDCKLHEYRQHRVRNIVCTVCKQNFLSCKALVQHMESHRRLRRFACSNCHVSFECSTELAKHWISHADTCGRLKKPYLSITETVETTLTKGSEDTHNVEAIKFDRLDVMGSFGRSSIKHYNLILKDTEKQAGDKPHLREIFMDAFDVPAAKRAKFVGKEYEKQDVGCREDFADACDTLPEDSRNLTREEAKKQVFINESANEVKIKTEPQTDHEIPDDLRSVATNVTSTNESETSSSFIKSEPSDSEFDTIVIKEEPKFDEDYASTQQLDSLKELQNPGFRVIPANAIFTPQQPIKGDQQHKATNLRLVRLPGRPAAPPAPPLYKLTNGLKPLKILDQNIKVSPMNMKAFKIFKIMPNTKMPQVPSDGMAVGTIVTTKNSNTGAPIILKLKPPAQNLENADVNHQNVNVKTKTMPLSKISLCSTPLSSTVKATKTASKPIVVQLPSLGTNTSIDAEDLKRLVIEAEAAKNSADGSIPPTRKNTCKTREELQMIEKLPQKRALIENWKQQVKQLETQNKNEDKMNDESCARTEANVDGGHESILEQANHEANILEKLEKPKLFAKYNSQQPVKPMPKFFAEHKSKITVKPEPMLIANYDFQTVCKKGSLSDSFDTSNFLQSETNLSNRIETALNNVDEKNFQYSDDEHDADEYDSNDLIIDEDDDGNSFDTSLSMKSDDTTSDFAATLTQKHAMTLATSLTTTNSIACQDPPILHLPVTTDCDPELQSARKLYPHVRYQWRCPRCPRAYAQKHSFRGHLVSAHGMCQEEFIKLIVAVKPSECAKSLEELKSPPKTALQPNSESESESNATVDSNSSMTDAAQNKQPKSYRNASKLTCAKCGRVCSTRTALNDHILANCSREPQYPCTICPKRFFSASTLSQHMSIHTGALPHKCNYCDKRFRTRGQVTVHHRTHTGERPFECQICGQRFTHRETLISHLSRHIGMKRYKCYGCNQQFACISGLKTHREVRFSSCGKVKLNTRAIGPRVRVIKGNVVFEAQPEINPYLRTEDPQEILAEVENMEKP